MKAILLAGGTGSRMAPTTWANNKHLFNVYDKPMVYYPLSTLMLSGLKDILIIVNPHDKVQYERLLGDGSQWGVNIEYAIQEHAGGIAQAFIIGEEFIGDDSVCLILGDNIIYGQFLGDHLPEYVNAHDGATVFAYHVSDPERYGVVSFDETGKATDIVEKPKKPKSNYAVTGLYFYGPEVVEIAKTIKPSGRGELEITDINSHYLEQEKLKVERFGRGTLWLDTGTPDSLLEAENFIAAMQKRTQLRLGCPEEIAWRKGFIDDSQFEKLGQQLEKTDYGQYLLHILEEGK